jgi:hypothetical protein
MKKIITILLVLIYINCDGQIGIPLPSLNRTEYKKESDTIPVIILYSDTSVKSTDYFNFNAGLDIDTLIYDNNAYWTKGWIVTSWWGEGIDAEQTILNDKKELFDRKYIIWEIMNNQ